MIDYDPDEAEENRIKGIGKPEPITPDTKPVEGLGEATVKSCPFCGDSRAEFNSGWKCYRVDCGAAGPTYSDPDKATERWNARPIEDSLKQRVKVLEEALKLGILEAKDSLEACGGCDHSVGICACSLIHNIETMESAITPESNFVSEFAKTQRFEEALKSIAALCKCPRSRNEHYPSCEMHAVDIAEEALAPPVGEKEK